MSKSQILGFVCYKLNTFFFKLIVQNSKILTKDRNLSLYKGYDFSRSVKKAYYEISYSFNKLLIINVKHKYCPFSFLHYYKHNGSARRIKTFFSLYQDFFERFLFSHVYLLNETLNEKTLNENNMIQ